MLELRLKLFQAFFSTTILSNCETWGPWIPQKVFTPHNLVLKLALDMRISTPTALIYLETCQHSVKSIYGKDS